MCERERERERESKQFVMSPRLEDDNDALKLY